MTIGMEHEIHRNLVFRFRYSNKNVIHAIEDMANLSNDFGESYVIGNPGQGLALQLRNQVGYIRQSEAKAVRRYNGAEFVIDKGPTRSEFLHGDWFINVNYTWSRLYGNYSGLASSDEKGRSDPGVNRFFDYPVNGFTLSGQRDLGLLPTDRTHVLKSYGGYTFDWMGSHTSSTTLSYFTTFQSGTPVTTFIDIEGSFIPKTQRGDLGRTPMFSQTDLNLTHRYRFGRDERFTMAFDVNVTNVFNEANVIDINNRQNVSGASNALHCGEAGLPAGATACQNYILQNGAVNEYNTTLAANPLRQNSLFGYPAAFQAPRSIRFGFRLLF
ncbi:MAG: hypothetical protein ACJ73D_09965 [Pyrinomonadaceae bacterium]